MFLPVQRCTTNFSVLSGFSLLSAVAVIAIALGYLIFNSDGASILVPDSVTFESLESKNERGEPIYNQIRFVADTKNKKDIWMMRQDQGHAGFPWDSLAIVVDKSKRPFAATFYQLDPEKKEFSPIPYKVRCFICHPNGPRVIRPEFSSAKFPLSLQDKFQILKWNIKIKVYGRVVPKSYSEKDPIKFTSEQANKPLKVGLCVTCHKESGFLARGTLTRQNFLPIQFLTENGHMPPLGIPMLEKTKRELEDFISGS